MWVPKDDGPARNVKLQFGHQPKAGATHYDKRTRHVLGYNGKRWSCAKCGFNGREDYLTIRAMVEDHRTHNGIR